MVTTKLNLSMTEPSVRQIYAKQGDTGRVLDITLDQTPEDGTLRILRPDGTEVTSEAVTGGEVESGSTFESLTEADVTELTVGIEPVQDLNGYDKPWVGGAGKNKFDISYYDLISQWTNVSGVITNVGNPLSGNYIGCPFSGHGSTTLSAGTYTLSLKARLVSGEYTAGTFNALRLHTNGADIKDFQRVSNPRISNVFQTYYGVLTLEESYSFEDMNLQFSTGLSNAVFEIKEIQIEAGSTATAWQPYSNICPITGHDEVTVTRTGKNMLNSTAPTTIDLNGQGANRYAQIFDASGTYTIVNNSASDIDIYYRLPTKDLSDRGTTAGVPTNGSRTVSVDANHVLWVFRSANTDMSSFAVNRGTDTAWTPYQGNTYTTSLGQTVYGGTLDMVSGVLTVDARYITVDDFSDYNGGVSGGGLHWVNVPKTYPAGVNDDTSTNVCSHAPYSSNNSTGWASRTPMYSVNSGGGFPARVYVASASLADFKTEYATLQAVYKLAEPVEYQLTPQQIKTLVGTNNVWASSGDIVNITFTYGGLLSELPSQATSVVGKCYCDVEQNGVSSMPFTLNVKKNERQ